MKIAIIDLGTNIFHLLIGEQNTQGFREIFRKRIYVQLGQGGLAASYLIPDAQQRALEAMFEFRKLIDKHHTKHIYAVATSAIRNARNGAALIAHIQELTNIQVDIISGSQESMLIYQGVKASSAIGPDKSLIMEIGGGSVEFIICNMQGVLWEQSFEIGVQRLLDNFHQHDPILPEELIQLENYLEENLQPLLQALAIYRPKHLIGTSGAFATLVAIHQAQAPYKEEIDTILYELPKPYINQTYEAIRHMTAKERLQMPDLAQERVDMIVVSSALIHYILHKSRISHIVVSSYSLKMGLFFQAVKEIQQKNLTTF